MLTFLQWAIPFLITLGILVLVHEAGHFFVALWSGMKVHEFAIGFPPRVLKWTRKGTLYSIGAVPLGGFVRIAGMEPGEEDSKDGFNSKSLGARFAVLFAGSFMNFVLAALLFAFVFGVKGQPMDRVDNTVVNVVEKPTKKTPDDKLPAERAGIKKGDRVVAVNGIPVSDGSQIVKLVRANGTKEMTLTILRHEKRLNLRLKPELRYDYTGRKVPQMGIHFRVLRDYKPIGLAACVPAALHETWKTTESIFDILRRLVRRDPEVTEGIGGPAMIAYAAGIKAKEGFFDYVLFLATLSINLGFINLLPLPALDGGRILFLLIEFIGRRKINPRWETMVHVAGFAFLIFLILFITAKDIGQLIGWHGR